MDSTIAQQPFVPLFDTLASRHSTAASIWAPQPQPSNTAWSHAIDSISRLEHGLHDGSRPEARRTLSYPSATGGEDVFGPVGFLGSRRKDVGAIGDGRKKNHVDCDTKAWIYAPDYDYMLMTLTCSTSNRCFIALILIPSFLPASTLVLWALSLPQHLLAIRPFPPLPLF